MSGTQSLTEIWIARPVWFESEDLNAATTEAIGIKGVRTEERAEVQEKLAEALAHPGPVLIDAVVNRMELAMPPRVTAETAKGFTLYMLKAVLNGRADEIARSNLLRSRRKVSKHTETGNEPARVYARCGNREG